MSFSVKWITTLSGIERTRIFQADLVEAFFPDTSDGKMPTRGVQIGSQPAEVSAYKHHDYDLDRASVFLDAGPNGAGFKLSEGRVYVMNAEGRTVGSYDLGYQEVSDPRPGLQR